MANFHKDITHFEICYQQQYHENTVRDYMCGLLRETFWSTNEKAQKF